jgi:cell wall-associated NlpC family hydrolase
MRSFAIQYALLFVGRFYSWGGDTPNGFDCSGYVSEVLKSVGVLKRKERYNAKDLYTLLRQKEIEKPCAGCLIFYDDGNGNIIHVDFAVTDELSIGASGGTSKTITIADAIRDGAWIKVRPISSRGNIVAYVDPFKGG